MVLLGIKILLKFLRFSAIIYLKYIIFNLYIYQANKCDVDNDNR
jgi:hypothetical protein